MKFTSYRIDFRNFRKQAKWFETERGALNAASRFATKGEHGTVYGLWYDANGAHEELIKKF